MWSFTIFILLHFEVFLLLQLVNNFQNLPFSPIILDYTVGHTRNCVWLFELFLKFRSNLDFHLLFEYMHFLLSLTAFIMKDLNSTGSSVFTLIDSWGWIAYNAKIALSPSSNSISVYFCSNNLACFDPDQIQNQTTLVLKGTRLVLKLYADLN